MRTTVILTDAEYAEVKRRAGLVPLSRWFKELALGEFKDNTGVPRNKPVRVAGRGVAAPERPANVAAGPYDEEGALPVSLPVEPTQPIKRRECDHGIMAGYHCWRCGGKAQVNKRV